MAASSYNATTGAPEYDDADAPDLAVNPTEVAAFAASVGTRPIGDTTARGAYAYAREGLRWYDETEDFEYLHNGSGWKHVTALSRSYTPTLTGMTLGSGGTVTATVGASDGRFWMSFEITLGSSPGFSDPNISVPSWADHAHLPQLTVVGDVLLYDVSATTTGRYRGAAWPGSSSTTLRLLLPNTGDGRLLPITSATVPFAWVAGDKIIGHVSYPLV